MTADEQHRVECDLERASLRKDVDGHDQRLAAAEQSIVAINTKLAVWSGGGAILGAMIGKLIF